MSSSFRSPAASLRESFLVALLDSAVDYAIVATDLDGRVLEWNRSAELASGWSAAEAVGRTVDVLFPPEDAAAGLPASQMRARSTRTARSPSTAGTGAGTGRPSGATAS